MPRLIRIGILGCMLMGLHATAHASGSASPGHTTMSVRGAYSAGKALLFRTLVCPDCAIERRALDRERAEALKGRLEAALDESPNASEVDPVTAICDAGTRGPEDCADRLRAVVSYLDRRFRL